MIEPVDKYVIKRVKEKRLEMGYSQSQLAHELDISSGFIGMVESDKYEHKYSVAQLNKIAKLFKCSPKDFMPEKPL